jgi:hypothetical protein
VRDKTTQINRIVGGVSYREKTAKDRLPAYFHRYEIEKRSHGSETRDSVRGMTLMLSSEKFRKVPGKRVLGQKGHAFLPSLFSFLVTFYYSNSLLATLPKRSCFSDLLHIYFSNYSNRFSVLSIFISHNI